MSALTYTQLTQGLKTAMDVDYQQEQVCDMLDSLQHTPEELQALEDLVYHIHTGKDTDEYEPFNQDIMIGGFDKDLLDEEYFRMLDRDEMIGDMFAFEDENQTHELLAQNPWSTRSSSMDSVSKKTEATFPVQVTQRGDNYSTGTSSYGKVYIPKACSLPEDVDTIKVRARFQGFDGCRKSVMPWRVIAIIYES